ncbi:hypothetical protein HFK74_04595|uniref:hypothetical protein n=1 Tax=Pseudomonas sp. SbOxS1 TaxID=2723884 RepID=UPI0015D3CFB6|nr:hypothetical protein [Pseudomonas sp. SbOxS1]NYU01979.1 hypothetical protein [Pseudomonas sp. SbOxS1]
MPAKNDDAVRQEHRSAWFAGKPGSYKAKNDDAVRQGHRSAWFAGKPGSYKAKNDDAVRQMHRSVRFVYQRAVIFHARWILALREKSASMVWAVISSIA